MVLLTHPKASVKQRERIPQPTPELGHISNRDLDRVVLAGDVTIATRLYAASSSPVGIRGHDLD